MMEFSGTLEKWFYTNGRLCGFVYNDPQHRFKDGEKLVTSFVVTRTAELKEGYYANTLNSTYLLGKEIGI